MIPEDPIILLSYVNTKLRNNYSSLQDFCAEEGVEEKSLLEILGSVGYEYDSRNNQFISV
ncbi:MAG: DUF4250 domain-containing protein [Lachnospiraceae bacterium]|nr:DUF4250 domain-containing protein [Lachnospiraceae bacterium]